MIRFKASKLLWLGRCWWSGNDTLTGKVDENSQVLVILSKIDKVGNGFGSGPTRNLCNP